MSLGSRAEYSRSRHGDHIEHHSYPPSRTQDSEDQDVWDDTKSAENDEEALSLHQRGEIMRLNDKRKGGFQKIDDTKLLLYHYKVCAFDGLGFFIDAYDFFAIDIVASILAYQRIYLAGGTQQATFVPVFFIKVAAPIGAVIGQLLFGWLGDKYGRKKMYGTELAFICIATLAQAVAGGSSAAVAPGGPSSSTGSSSSSAVNIFYVIFLWRILMGIGNGGNYPITAIITSEFSPVKYRGRLMTAVFSTQALGQTVAAVVSLIAISTFKLTDFDAMWRMIIGFGCVPTAIALFLRTTMTETPRFTMDIERDVDRACAEIDDLTKYGKFPELNENAVVKKVKSKERTLEDFVAYFKKPKNLGTLIGVCWSWFVLDIAFYGLSQNSSLITQVFVPLPSSKSNPSEWQHDLIKSAAINLGYILGGQVPGFIASFFLVDIWGRKPIQFMGFGALAVIFLIMGAGYGAMLPRDAIGQPAPKSVFLFFYFLANFFINFGPNTTTFILPAELFPTRYRSTVYGIAAACGKLGAIIVQIGYLQAQRSGTTYDAVRKILISLGPAMATGILSTYFINPETNQGSLEENSGEEQETFIKGIYSRDPLTASS